MRKETKNLFPGNAMPNDPAIDILQLHYSDAPKLAPLIANYTQALKRGAPRQPDQFYAEQLLQDRSAEFLGAYIDGELVGFVTYFDLPDPISGKRAGQADHIYVHHEHRGKGIAKALVDVLAEQGESLGWQKLVLNAPKSSEIGNKVFSELAPPAEHASYELKF